jgi:iron complex transport system substrate-binding protein
MHVRPWNRGHAASPGRALLVALVLLLVGVSCSRGSNPSVGTPGTTSSRPGPVTSPTAFPLTLTDDEGVTVTLDAAPRRIVTFAPANTEIVFALGLGSRLVGVSYHAFDNYPPAAKSIPEVGGSGVAPNIEQVVALHPDLLLATAGGQDWKQRLRGLGIPVFSVNATSFEDALHDIETIGRLTGTQDRAAAITAQMRAQAQSLRARIAIEPPVTCFLDIGGLYTVGPHDFLFDLLRLAGCEPVTANATSSYPQWSKEQLLAEDPAVFLFTSDSGDSVKGIEGDPALKGLTAVRLGRVGSVDADLVSRPGPRLVEGLEALAQMLHPGAFD